MTENVKHLKIKAFLGDSVPSVNTARAFVLLPMVTVLRRRLP